MPTKADLPKGLHHTAYVTKDLEATRAFYEDLIGLPLVATWAEQEQLFGKERTYCHCFFGMGDGSALAFFQFANVEDEVLFGPPMPASPFHHIALNVDAKVQGEIEARLLASDQKDKVYVLEHGYCRSVYITDPNGMIVEFTADAPDADQINATRRRSAHEDLKQWLSGDHTPNNRIRAHAS
jgi:catechol 2,3-dioxygenase-like lactoylglutathione lyase family enzyme